MKRHFICALLVVLLITSFIPMTVSAKTDSEQWLWPVESATTVISNFGLRDISGNGNWQNHSGIDISCPMGSAIRAAKSGSVFSYCNKYGNEEKMYTDDMTSYGNYIAIKHDDGTYSLYAHMSNYDMVTSGRIAQGDVIGYSGNSGHSYGPHCHFQATKNPSQGWSNPNNIINTMPTRETISQLGLTINNEYRDGNGYPTNRMTYIFSTKHEYFNDCTFYPSFGRITISKSTYAKTLPCSRKTCEDSDDIRRVEVGEELTVTAMYQNSAGNFWYEVEVDGETCYVYAGDTTYEAFYKDATIENVSAPTSLNRGSRFSIKGDISSEYCKITSVYGSIHKGGAQFIYHCQDEIQGNSYSLLNSKIDMALLFNELPAGSYYYEIDVTVPYYYSYDGKTLEKSEECFTLAFQEFTVK